MTVRAYIGLGSNLDDPRAQVLRALDELEHLPASCRAARSSLYLSRPLGVADQPDFVNAVAALDTRLAPPELLGELQAIEAAHGRVRGDDRWGSRTLDLDLLLYGAERFAARELVVPHPGLAERDFVLYPLYEIAPELTIPGLGPLREYIGRCPVRGLQRLEVGGGPETP